MLLQLTYRYMPTYSYVQFIYVYIWYIYHICQHVIYIYMYTLVHVLLSTYTYIHTYMLCKCWSAKHTWPTFGPSTPFPLPPALPSDVQRLHVTFSTFLFQNNLIFDTFSHTQYANNKKQKKKKILSKYAATKTTTIFRT